MTNKNDKIEGLQLAPFSLTCMCTTLTFTHQIALLCRFSPILNNNVNNLINFKNVPKSHACEHFIVS